MIRKISIPWSTSFLSYSEQQIERILRHAKLGSCLFKGLHVQPRAGIPLLAHSWIEITVASLLLRGSSENAWKMPVKTFKFAKSTPGKRMQCSYLFEPSAFWTNKNK